MFQDRITPEAPHAPPREGAEEILHKLDDLARLLLRRDGDRLAEALGRLDALEAEVGRLRDVEGRLQAALADQGRFLLDGLLAERDRTAEAIAAQARRLEAVEAGGGGAGLAGCLGTLRDLSAHLESVALDRLPGNGRAIRAALDDLAARLARMEARGGPPFEGAWALSLEPEPPAPAPSPPPEGIDDAVARLLGEVGDGDGFETVWPRSDAPEPVAGAARRHAPEEEAAAPDEGAAAGPPSDPPEPPLLLRPAL